VAWRRSEDNGPGAVVCRRGQTRRPYFRIPNKSPEQVYARSRCRASGPVWVRSCRRKQP